MAAMEELITEVAALKEELANKALELIAIQDTAFWTKLLFWATTLLGLTTALTILVGVVGLFLSRTEAIKWKTLDICNEYDSNEIYVKSADVIHTWFEQLDYEKANWSELNRPAKNILNYLDGIAIGVKQRVYNREIVVDHLGPILKKQVDRLLSEHAAAKLKLPRDDFACLIAFREELRSPNVTYTGR